MSTMEFIQLRDELIKKLLDTKDESILKQLKEVFNNNKNEDEEFVFELSENDKKGIELGLQQIENGEVFTYEEIISKHR